MQGDVCFEVNDELLHVETELIYFVSSVWNCFCRFDQKIVLTDRIGRAIATSKGALNREKRDGVWKMVEQKMEIKSREDLEKALNRIDEIWSAKPGDVDFKERNILVEMVSKWEDENIRIDPPTKEEAELFRKEQEKNIDIDNK
jgi:hypothetical protein